MQVTTLGLDLAKRVFQVHGVDAAGKPTVRRKLLRSEMVAFFASLPPCLVGIEACATAHHWARLIGAAGHDVRLIPPSVGGGENPRISGADAQPRFPSGTMVTLLSGVLEARQ